MTNKDTQQESNITEFPNIDTSETQEKPQLNEPRRAENEAFENNTIRDSESESERETRERLAEYRLRAEIQERARHKKS
ncbi:hypothetical protein [Pseudomonas monsensis]|uniref:hypothetical protein n=1 Tax=Pseudomonas monsensis TaxID=2745509 RepID=UPI002AB9D58A|nr:hypothetical protein [Pseudomonas monsensis]MDZ3826085.1 hypothetical protein [Pseudomonas monsensis]